MENYIYKYELEGERETSSNEIINGNTKLLVNWQSINNLSFKRRVRGVMDNGTTTPWTDYKCISIEACNVSSTNSFIGPINYSTPLIFNSNFFTSQNIISSKELFPKTTKYYESEKHQMISVTPIWPWGDLGDPVMLNTGEFIYDNTLMTQKSTGIAFNFQLHYENQAYYRGPVGNNFDHNYNQFLLEDTDGNLVYHNGKLGAFVFTGSGGMYEKNELLQAELEETASGYTLSFDNQKTISFGENKKISSLSDRFGNTMSFNYDENLQLLTITDTENRLYTLAYNEETRLESLTDFNGDIVSFNYFSTGATEGQVGDLQTITTSVGSSTQDISFTYTTAEEFENAHNIVKLIDSENNTYVENSYNTDDRVVTQVYGNGTILYDYEIDENNKIIQNTVTDRQGDVTIYEYDTKGNTLKRTEQSDQGNTVYEFEYNLDNNLISEIYPLDNGYSYSYDSNNNVIEKRLKQDISAENSSDDLVTSYVYDLVFNKLLTVTQANGLTINYALDVNGHVISKRTQGTDIDYTETYVYNSFGQLISLTDPNGNITQMSYEFGNIVELIKKGATISEDIVTVFEYDTQGNLIKLTDPRGNETQMSYDDFNLISQIQTPEGGVTQQIYNNLNKKTSEKIILSSSESVDSSYSYDILDNLTQSSSDYDSSRQAISVRVYDTNSHITKITAPNGGISEFEYDSFENIVKKTQTAGVKNIITLYNYDENNRLVTQTNPNGGVSSFEYDLFDRIIQQTDALGNYRTLSYDLAGNIKEQLSYSSENSLVQKTSYSYDQLSHLISKNDYIIGSSEILTHIYEYDNNGNVVKSINPQGSESISVYDSFDRVTEKTDILGNILSYSYDKNSNIISESISSTTGKTITTTYVYDADNRRILTTDANNNTIAYSYNKLNQIIEKIDKKSVKTHYSYDYAGNILTELSAGRLLTYEYDLAGNMTKLIDANNNETNYEYDNFSNLIQQTYPDNTTVHLAYDSFNRLITKTDANGTVIHYTYDSLNRLIEKNITLANGVLGITKENYFYDSLSRLIQTTDSDSNELLFTYDSLNRLISETNNGKTVNYSYDVLGNKTNLELDGKNTSYTYDSSSRLTSILEENTEIVSYSYDSLNLLQKSYSNGEETNYTYDTLSRLESLRDYTYSYDNNSNILSNGVDSYSYDNLNRIITTEYSEKHIRKISESYEYDAMGNRLTENLTRINKRNKEKTKNLSYTINNLNQYSFRTKDINISGTGTTTGTGELEEIELEGDLIYDNNGNLIGNNLNNKRQYIYSYDYKNRLIKIEKNIYKKIDGSETGELELVQRVVQMSYDTLGRRTSKLFHNGRYRKYYYSNQDIILEERYNKNNKLKNSKEFIYGTYTDDILSVKNIERKTRKITEEYVNKRGKTKTRQVRENYTETNRYFYSKNHLGSIVAITDETGTIIEQYAYNAFGIPYTKEVNGTITRLKKSLIGNTRFFTGREYDRGLKLYYNRARYYNPQLGRFISRDPIDISDDVNLYSYVGNNPVGYVDRMGREKLSVFLQTSDATERFLEFIEKGKKFQYSYKYQPKYNINYIIGDISLKGPTVSDTLPFYLNASKPGGEFDVKRSNYFKWKKNINGKYSKDTNQIVQVNGSNYATNELGNFFIGLNGQRAGVGLNEIKNYGLAVEYKKSRDSGKPINIKDESYDQKFYKAGYVYGLTEKYGNLNQSQLDFSSFYFLNLAKNEK